MYRPALHIAHKGPDRVEIVALQRQDDEYETTSGGLRFKGKTLKIGHSKYVRAHVSNTRGPVAKDVQVFVERVWKETHLLDDERSPLEWRNHPGVFLMREMPKGDRYGHYVDVFSVDSISRDLVIHSHKHSRGYHTYQNHGLYTVELSAESKRPCHFGKFQITVKYDGDLDRFHVVSTREGNLFWNFGWKAMPPS